MLALRSQIFEYLRETFRRRCVGVPAIGSFRKQTKTIFGFPMATPDRCRPFWRTTFVVGGGTFSPPAPVVGSEQKTGAMSPSFAVHGG